MENIECESAIINFNDKRIVRQVKDDFYQLDLISKYCDADLKTVGQFLNSQKFDFFLNLIDKDHKIYDYVYLIKQPFGIKFGNVIYIDQECFLNELNTDLKRFVFVSDSEECLQALKIGFSKFKRIAVDEFEMNLCKNMYEEQLKVAKVKKEKYEKMLQDNVYQVKLGIRPEDVYVENSVIEPSVVKSNLINVTITIPELLGHEYFLHTLINNKDFILKTSANNDIKENENVNVFFNLEKIHLFDTIDDCLLV